MTKVIPYLSGALALASVTCYQIHDKPQPPEARLKVGLIQPIERDPIAKQLASAYSKPEALVDYMVAHARLNATERVSVPLVMAVASIESSLNPTATSRAGAKGVMQIMKTSGKQPAMPYSIPENIAAGVDILDENIAKFGLKGGLHAYNVGPTAYKKGKRNHQYVKKVLAVLDKLNRLT